MQGTVVSRGQSRNGKPIIVINSGHGDQTYYPGKTDIAGLVPGDLIEFESKAFGDKGNLYGLNKWKLIEGARKYPSSMAGLPAQPTPAVLPRENGMTSTTGITEGERAFISNVVAHAIDAKLIVDPATMGIWAVAAKNAIRKAAETSFEEDIP
jgi:hypothetical protein